MYDIMFITMILASIIAAIDITRVIMDMRRAKPARQKLTYRVITPEEWRKYVWLNVTQMGEPENYLPGPARIGEPERRWDKSLLTCVLHEVT